MIAQNKLRNYIGDFKQDLTSFPAVAKAYYSPTVGSVTGKILTRFLFSCQLYGTSIDPRHAALLGTR
jgi:hypothetical protein